MYQVCPRVSFIVVYIIIVIITIIIFATYLQRANLYKFIFFRLVSNDLFEIQFTCHWL